MKPQRNAPCPCGSGKKFKKCHEPLLNTAKQGAIARANRRDRWNALEAEIQKHSKEVHRQLFSATATTA